MDEEFLLKPMNCPHHCEIYNSRKLSYKDLPVRYAEFGTVYRYEQSGELHGLTRVRGFTQDDAHIFCTEDQLNEEFKKVNSFENLENTLLKVGGRVGNLMDVVQEAMDPESPLGKDLSKKEKDLISKSIIELEEKIAKLKMSIK